jgi:2-keto-4-pentenoate hydratase/2-oxohepta-3-ene-1,7-dioic acid hydratase in catechol pathway
VKLAQVRKAGSSEFVLAPKSSDRFISWKEIQKVLASDKLVQSIETLDDYVKQAEWVHPLVRKSEAQWAQLSGQEVAPTDFLKPFAPVQFRDFYCFEEHVKNGRRSRGLEMIPEWYQFPVFYYSNHMSIEGPNTDVRHPVGCKNLDFELEVGAVVGKRIRNATVEQAHEAILGYCLVNDWSARDFQAPEMKLNMGPHKGKDFCTNFGPFIITPDEYEGLQKAKGFDVDMELRLNEKTLVQNNWSKIQFSFEEMLVRASKDCDVYPGELLGSGTVGMGSLMEHNLDRPEGEKLWLKPGDLVELRMKPNLILRNRIVAS